MIEKKPKGPVQILCNEVGAVFEADMERPELLIGYVVCLVNEIKNMMMWRDKIAEHVAEASVPSDDSKIFADDILRMLETDDYDSLPDECSEVRRGYYQPDEAIPCDHYLDMLHSCVSAIQFGLEKPCHSRHAAAAAQHIWKIKYGVSLFDGHSNQWGKQWARDMFYLSMANR